MARRLLIFYNLFKHFLIMSMITEKHYMNYVIYFIFQYDYCNLNLNNTVIDLFYEWNTLICTL